MIIYKHVNDENGLTEYTQFQLFIIQ